MLYVPNYESTKCVELLNNNQTIRLYDSIPNQRDLTYTYTDYYVNLGYTHKNGSVSFGQYQSLPSCFDSNQITTDFYYRMDFDKILTIFFVIVIICIYFPFRIFSRAFGRWLKV